MRSYVKENVGLSLEKHTEASRVIKAFVIFFALIALVLIADQLTKEMARQSLALTGHLEVFIPGILNLIYVENTGAAFGILEGARWYFVIMAAVVTMASVLYLAFDKFSNFVEVFALSLIVSGAIGNVIDRIFHGYVTDFFSFAFINFPVFNVADIAITIGAVLFVAAVLLSPSHKKAELG